METATTLQDKVSLLLKSSRDYLESKVELEVLKGADKIAQGTSALAILLFAIGLGTVFLLILFIGISVWLNELLNSGYAGYFITAGFLLLVMILLFGAGRKSIKKTVINKILNSIDHD